MGERTVSRRRTPRWLLGTDGWLVVAVATLLLWGLLMVYSSGADFAWWHLGGDAFYLFRRQLFFVLITSVWAVLLAAVDYRFWQRFAVPALFLIWILLFLALIFGHARAVGRFLSGRSLQPSEWAKVVLIFYLAVWLARRKGHLDNPWTGLYPLAALVGITASLVLLEPDLSAAITMVLLGMMMFFLAGGRLRHLAVAFVVMLVVGALFVMVYPRGHDRVVAYLAGLNDPQHALAQIRLAFAAVARGGIFGVGPGQSQIKVRGLPLAPTDSIFAVVAEEFGVLGATVMVILFGLIVWRGLKIAFAAPDEFGRLLAAGLAFWIGLEAFMNMAMMLNLLPLAGNALPFISYGGSNLLSVMSAVGLILSVGRASARERLLERSDTGAVVSLRRRNRRRRVSSAVGASGVRE